MVRTKSASSSRSRSRSPRERVDKFGRLIPPGKRRSMSRSRSRERFRRRSRSPLQRRHYRSRSRSRSRESRASRSNALRAESSSSFRAEHNFNIGQVQREKDVTNRTNIEDPAFLNARIFIGKLPSDRCSKEELEVLFGQYGKILGVSIHDRGFGFVQFEKEEDARRGQEGENGTKFKGQVLDVKMAAEGRRGQGAGRGAPDRGVGRGAAPPGRDFDREPGGYPARDGRGPAPPPPLGRDRSPLRGDPYEDRYRDPYARREQPPRSSVDRAELPPPPPRDDPYYADPYRRSAPSLDYPYRDPYRDDPYRRDPYRRDPRDPYDDPYRDPYYRDPYLAPPPPKKALPADVQIICMNKQLGQYADSIESRLRQHALIVDVVVIPADMTVPKMVEEASIMKFLFAIIINSQNETHKSLTLNILHGTPQEHRNMPLEDAMKLIATSFEKYIQTQREKATATPAAPAAAATPATPATPSPFVPPSSDISYLLNLLADNRQLTIEEITKVVDYLQERKDKLLKVEGVRPPAESPVAAQRPAPTGVQAPSTGDSTSVYLQQQQQALQSKILNILNGSGSSVSSATQQPQAVQAQAGYPGTGAVALGRSSQSQSSSNSLINFDNPNVQKALDNLIQSGPNLLKSLPSTVAQSTAPRLSQYQPSSQQQPTTSRQSVGYPSQQAQSGSQGAQAEYGGQQYGQFQQQSPMQGQAASRGPAPSGYGAQQQSRVQTMGARAPQPLIRPRY